MRARPLTIAVLCLFAGLTAQAGAASHHFASSLKSPFDRACGVAVDEVGNVYVADYNHRKVSVFGGSGLQFSIPSSKAENSPCDLAVDSADRIYGNYLHQGVVELLGAETIDPDRSTGISINTADDRLYVAHRDHVSVYEPNGSPAGLTIGAGSLVDAYGVAVSAAAATKGYVYVGDASDDTIKVFDPASDPDEPIQVIDGAGTPAGGFSDLTDTDLTVDPVNAHIFVVDNLQPDQEHPIAAVDEFDAAGSYVSQITHWLTKVEESPNPPKYFNHSLAEAGPTGLAIRGSGEILVTSGNEEEAAVYGFAPQLVTTSRLRVARAGTGTGMVTSTLNLLSTPSSPFSGIDCGLICATEFEPSLPEVPAPSLVASAAPHSRFTGWSGACSGIVICKPPTSGDVEVTATFEAIPQQTLTVSKAGDGEGVVSSAPVGVDCGPICAGGFDQGSEVLVTAEESPGSEFSGWSGACSGTGTCAVTLDQGREVTATFNSIAPPIGADPSKAPRRLAIVVGGTGAGTISSDPAGIDCGTPCSGVYAPGSVVTLVATPDSESHFTGWSGCNSVSAARCTVTLDSSKTVSAGFDEGPAVLLGAVKVKGSSGSIAVSVPGPGLLKASAKQLAPSKASSKRAETVRVPFALSKAGQKALARARSGRLAVKVAITFTPSGGGPPTVVTKTVTFKKGNHK
jgi:hypothetical protein